MRRARGLSWLCVAALAACGGRSISDERGGDSLPDGDAGDARDAGDDAAPRNCGTLYENNCPEGLDCYGASACDAAWQCVEEAPTCSAAAPFPVCGCDGRVGAAAAGCPGRYAWQLGGYPRADDGARCNDGLSAPPTLVDVRVLGTALGDFETLRVVLGEGRGRLDVPVANGGAIADFGPVLHSPGLYVVAVLADAGEQGVCVDGVDRVGRVYDGHFDALDAVARFEVQPDDLTATCAAWNP